MKNNLAENDAKVGEFMSSNTIKTRIQLKNDTEANWNQAQNFIPRAGEVIIYSGDNSRPFSRLKVGDGSTVVTALPFIHSGVMSINGLEPNISGNFELSAAAIGLNKPLNIVGFLAAQNNVDLTTGAPITDIPSITGLASYVPKEGDVVLDSRNGVEFACIQIETIETIDEETEEKVEETFYLWKQLGKNAAAVFQKDLMGTSENHNYPITLSPQIDATDTTDKILKDIYFNFNPVNKNLTIGSDLTPGTINGKPIGSAMSKDFIDYNYEVFPNGLNYKGIATNISSGSYNTYTLEDAESSSNAEHGDLVYLNSAAEENSGYYIFHLKDPINTSTWDKIVAKSIGQSDKLITERLLYYYEGNSNISKLGTITQGTWNGNIVDVAHGGTGVNSFINNGILYAGIENNATVVKSGIMSWDNWVNGTSNGPTIALKIGDVASQLQYTLPAIPIATNNNSGVITTTSQDIKGVKTFTSGAVGLRCVNTKLNQILFGTENLSDFDTGDELIGDSEFASINVKMPFNTTQFSFRQFKINSSEENGTIIYSKHSSVYEEYLLPEINNDITSTQTYNILTTKSLVTVAEGGTGQSSFETNKILYGNGNGPIQSETPEWKAWVADTTAGPQAIFHIGNADYTSPAIPAASTSVSGIVTTEDQSFSGRKTFTGLHLNLTPATGEGGEIHLNASTANTTQAGIVLDQYNSTFRIFGIASADGETINGVGTPLVIDPYNKTITGGYTLTGSLTGHASLDLPLTGGTLTDSLTIQKNGLWIQGGSAAGSNNSRMGLTSGIPDAFPYNQSKRGVKIYSNAIALADPYNGNSNNDAGWLRHIEETANSGVLELGVGDDGNESIVARQYNTSSAIVRTLTLLNASGNSDFPGAITGASTITAGTYVLANTYVQAKNHMYLDAGHFQMKYNNTWYTPLYNHNNGNISVNAASSGLYLGYYNTTLINFMDGRAILQNGCLSLFPNNGDYREGLRIHSTGNWSDITLCGNDNTGNNGTSANSWFIGNNNGNFYIARNGSTGGTANLKCVDNAWTFSNSVTMAGDLFFANSGTGTRQIRGVVGNNDYWRIAGGATAANAGWMEIATADDGNEPIYVRQYTGAYATITRTLTLLDASGNTSLPGNLTISHATNATMTAASTNPQITFAENGGQPVHLIYTEYDSYRSPAGLKVVGGTDATPAWFEVEGQVYAAGFNGPLSGNATTATRIATFDITGGDGNTAGYRLAYTWTISAWANHRMTFAVKSRHQGCGIISITVGNNTSTVNRANMYGEITYWGPRSSGDIISSSRWQLYGSSDGTKAYLFWYYSDYSPCTIIPLSDLAPSNGTWMTSIASSYGTLLASTDINKASSIQDAGDTSKTLTIRYQGSEANATDWIPMYDSNGNLVPVSSTNLANKVRDKASGTWGINVTGNAANVTGTVAVANGGTGSTSKSGARTNLGIRVGYIATTGAVAAGNHKDYNITFSPAFSSAPIVIPGFSSGTTASGFGHCSVEVTTTSTTGATIRILNGDTQGRSPSLVWIAIGD